MVRRFVALGVDERVRGLLAAGVQPAKDTHPDLAWTDPDGWHVTLAFIGALEDDRFIGVERSVRRASDSTEVAAVPRTVGLGPVARLGAALVVGVADEPAGALAELGARIQDELRRDGVPVVVRQVRAHVTLARARRRERVSDDALRAAADGLPMACDTRWAVRRVGIWSSHHRRGPARYVVDAEVELPL